MNKPLVSVCLPTYNGAQYLDETLRSIKSQTYQNLEVIVSDDASQDRTLEIVEAFKKEEYVPVFIYHHAPNGIGANWNNCMEHATGIYIKFLFQDDVLQPNCIEEMVQVLVQNPELALVASKREFIIEKDIKDFNNKWLEKYSDLQKEFNFSSSLNRITKNIFKSKTFISDPKNKIGEPSVVMFRKSLVDQVGYFREDLKQVLDYEYWYRIIKKHPIAIINKPLVKFRLHAQQATHLNRNQAINDYRIYEQILYKEYRKLLHPSLKKRLYLKYHPLPVLKNRIKNKLKRLLK